MQGPKLTETSGKSKASPPPTPEDLIAGHEEPPIPLVMRCNVCHAQLHGIFEWACLHPKPPSKDDEWDGILLSRIVTCGRCGAVDDYTLTEPSLWRVRDAALTTRGGVPGRVIIGESRLWDGTISRRPSQGLARLRELCVLHPGRPDALRRLGNGCERFGLLDEAEQAWEQALALDPLDLEASYSLAAYWLGAGGRPEQGFACLRRAISAIPKATTRPDRGPWPDHLLRLLGHAIDAAGPLALTVAWLSGETKGDPVVTISSVDLRQIDFGRLSDFIENTDLIAIDLVSELPQGTTNLQVLLSAERLASPIAGRATRVRALERPGRNALCPCGSGKKYKRCCAG